MKFGRHTGSVKKHPMAFTMLDKLIASNFQVDFRSHAKAILEIDFPEVAEVIESVLLESFPGN
jgi:hypothetical protein